MTITGYSDMTSTSSSTLNDQGCVLLSRGSVSSALEVFKKALSELKSEVQQISSHGITAAMSRPRNNAICSTISDFVAVSISGATTFQHQSERYWVYSRPLLMREMGDDPTNIPSCLFSNTCKLTFNVALASHLQGLKQTLEGHSDAAEHSFVVARNMYHLTLRQVCCDHFVFYDGNELLYAAIINNLAHVHAILGEGSNAATYVEQLLKTLFYFSDSGLLVTPGLISAHSYLMENASLLTTKSASPAAAA